MIYKSVIFDLDGTLIDSALLTSQIIDAMLAARGATRAADLQLIRAMDAVGGQAMIAAVMGEYGTDPDADIAEFRARFRRLEIPADLVFPDVAETLHRLAEQEIGIAICSNKPQDLCEKILRALGLDHYFAAIIGSGPDRPRKPHPACAFQALAILDSTPGGTLFCGDSVVDVATAGAAGIDACLVGWGYGTDLAMSQYPHLPVLEHLPDLFSLVHGTAP